MFPPVRVGLPRSGGTGDEPSRVAWLGGGKAAAFPEPGRCRSVQVRRLHRVGPDSARTRSGRPVLAWCSRRMI
jgi:hypothetical protein